MKSHHENIKPTANPEAAEIVKNMPEYIDLTDGYAAIQKLADELKEKIQWREALWTALQSARTNGDKEKIGELSEKIMNVSNEIAELAQNIDMTEEIIIQKESATLQTMMDSEDKWEQ